MSLSLSIACTSEGRDAAQRDNISGFEIRDY